MTVVLLLACSRISARPTTEYEAEQVVTGWLTADIRPLGTNLGRYVVDVQTFTNNYGEPIYYIVHLYPRGFVIVPADDLIEPIVCFTVADTYDASSENPLTALVTQDLAGRIETARIKNNQQIGISTFEVSDTQRKWNHFLSLAETATGKITIMSIVSIPDVRVAPLVQSKWSQLDVCNANCYNYYTPNNYYCGCVATAMAQIMRYHEYPTTGIGTHDFPIKVDENSQTASTMGGDGNGGQYNWADMMLVPTCSITEEQRQAIGSLCYDAGISINIEYSDDGSSADALDVKDALTDTFKYDNAVASYNDGDDIGSALIEMINPNLDAALPVILGIWRDESGHAVVCDGYGYNTSTLYHHLNMGWEGHDDVWYNLPNVDANPSYTSVIVCIYNIFPTGTGEIISGRVTDRGDRPIRDAMVVAQRRSQYYTATTNTKGIYALAEIPSASRYTITVTKAGYVFTNKTVTTGTSRDTRSITGNKWQVDFVGFTTSDLDGDYVVDYSDFAIFAMSWLTTPGQQGWNARCDISNPADDFVDVLDLAEFAKNWLAGTE